MGGRSIPADYSEICRRAIAGETMKSLAAEFGVSYGALKERARREKWGISKLHGNANRNHIPLLQLEAKQRRMQLASLVTKDCQEVIELASKSSRRNLAEAIHNLTVYFRDLPPEKFSPAKIQAFAALVKSAAAVFLWPTNRQLSLSLPHPSRRQPTYYDVTPADLPQFASEFQSTSPTTPPVPPSDS